MRIVADLHLHSKYARATSKDMDLDHLAGAAGPKGLNLLGTGDFTHPAWFKELKERLQPGGPGLFTYKGCSFMLTVEISSVYSVDHKVKKVHNIVCAPSFEIAAQINDRLAKRGNLAADGRPTFGMSAPELVEQVMGISKDCFVIPAHAWTPWFSIFGANSGFDSVEECFGDQAKHIHALETGLSSDPPMNWRISALDKYALVSNSDSHSYYADKLGRECNVFDCKLDYFDIIDAIKKKDKSRFLYTVEFFPEEGKYHWDGHRNCNVSLSPEEAAKHNNICPVCRKPLTIGVAHRVAQLADRPLGFVPPTAIPFKHVIPLAEIIANLRRTGVHTKAVQTEWQKLIDAFGSELAVLIDMPREKLETAADPRLVKAIMNARAEKVHLKPGYDGVYGQIEIEPDSQPEQIGPRRKQQMMSDFL